jgi:SAM-dependent methyltransferase
VLAEFTGERVVPGQVNDDLWSEHVARYAFARQFASGRKVLDAGCGTGYGAAELASVATGVVGFDVADDAINYARSHFTLPGLSFTASSAEAMPFRAHTFDLVVAFEVIEHLTGQRTFLQECARVLKRNGQLIVSSPNRLYYAESRAKTGPNPFHTHEFEAGEFLAELQTVFSHVRLLLQNRAEAFAFHEENSGGNASVQIDRGSCASDAHFLIGLCSFDPLPEIPSFVYVPAAANLLRERERHIQLLEQELTTTREWLATTQSDRDSLLKLHAEVNKQLETANRWAASLGTELEAAGQRIVHLQNEIESLSAAYEKKLQELEDENRAKTEWALDTEARLTAELATKCAELAECVRLLEVSEATMVERTQWAQRLEAQRADLAAKVDMVRASRWVRLGRKMSLGPDLDAP